MQTFPLQPLRMRWRCPLHQRLRRKLRQLGLLRHYLCTTSVPLHSATTGHCNTISTTTCSTSTTPATSLQLPNYWQCQQFQLHHNTPSSTFHSLWKTTASLLLEAMMPLLSTSSTKWPTQALYPTLTPRAYLQLAANDAHCSRCRLVALLRRNRKTTNHINHYLHITIALPTGYIQQLQPDGSLICIQL